MASTSQVPHWYNRQWWNAPRECAVVQSATSWEPLLLHLLHNKNRLLLRCVLVMTSRKRHIVVYCALSRRLGQPAGPLHVFDAGVWWLAFCEFYLTCRIGIYYVTNKGFSFTVISVSYFWLYEAGAWFTMWLVCGWSGQCRRCMVYADHFYAVFLSLLQFPIQQQQSIWTTGTGISHNMSIIRQFMLHSFVSLFLEHIRLFLVSSFLVSFIYSVIFCMSTFRMHISTLPVSHIPSVAVTVPRYLYCVICSSRAPIILIWHFTSSFLPITTTFIFFALISIMNSLHFVLYIHPLFSATFSVYHWWTLQRCQHTLSCWHFVY